MAPSPASAHALSEGHPAPTPPAAPADDFIFVKIPVARREGTDPLHRREDAIDQLLRSRGLGLVVGWGDSLGAPRADGQRPTAYIRIDIRVNDLQVARSELRALLPTLGAPAGTEVHYTLQGRSLLDMAGSTGWQLEQALPRIQGRLHR